MVICPPIKRVTKIDGEKKDGGAKLRQLVAHIGSQGEQLSWELTFVLCKTCTGMFTSLDQHMRLCKGNIISRVQIQKVYGI